MTDREAVADWIAGYLRAWDSNEPDDVRGLFVEGATYRVPNWDEPHVGHDAIVATWLEHADTAGDHRFSWTVVAVDGATVVVQAQTTYSDGDAYLNLWIIELADDGRARSFTEWYTEQPPKTTAADARD